MEAPTKNRTHSYVFTLHPPIMRECDTRLTFKQSEAGLNSELSF